jgi:hypothetical protein
MASQSKHRAESQCKRLPIPDLDDDDQEEELEAELDQEPMDWPNVGAERAPTAGKY